MAPGKQFPLSVVIEAIDKATAPLRKINRAISDTFKPINTLGTKLSMLGKEAGLGKLAKGLGGVREALGGVGEAVGTVAARFAAITGLVGGAIGFMVKSAADAGDAMNDTAERIGIGVETLSRWRYAAQLSGVEAGDLDTSLMKLNKTVIDAATGSESAAVWFKRAGVSIKDAHGKVKPTDQLLSELSDKFEKMPQGAAKTALAMGLFGKSGATMITMLNKGSGELGRLADEAKALGVTLTSEQANTFADWNDSLDRLSQGFKGLSNTVALAVIPVLKPLVDNMVEWWKANREVVASKIAEYAQQLPGIITQLTTALQQAWEVLKGFSNALLWVHDLFGSWKPVLIGAAAIIAGPLVSALVTLSGAFISLGVAIMTTPIGWVIAGIAAIVAAAYMLYKNWDTIWGGIKSATQIAVDAVRGIFDGLFGWLAEKFGWVGTVISKVAGAASGVFGGGGPQVGPAAMGAPVAAGAPVMGAATGAGLMQSTSTNNAAVSVDFTGVPKGTTIVPAGGNTAPLSLNVGYAMGT